MNLSPWLWKVRLITENRDLLEEKKEKKIHTKIWKNKNDQNEPMWWMIGSTVGHNQLLKPPILLDLVPLELQGHLVGAKIGWA